MGFELSCDSTFIWVAAIVSIFVFCALFLDGIGDFFGKLIGLVTLGGVFGPDRSDFWHRGLPVQNLRLYNSVILQRSQ